MYLSDVRLDQIMFIIYYNPSGYYGNVKVALLATLARTPSIGVSCQVKITETTFKRIRGIMGQSTVGPAPVGKTALNR